MYVFFLTKVMNRDGHLDAYWSFLLLLLKLAIPLGLGLFLLYVAISYFLENWESRREEERYREEEKRLEEKEQRRLDLKRIKERREKSSRFFRRHYQRLFPIKRDCHLFCVTLFSSISNLSSYSIAN